MEEVAGPNLFEHDAWFLTLLMSAPHGLMTQRIEALAEDCHGLNPVRPKGAPKSVKDMTDTVEPWRVLSFERRRLSKCDGRMIQYWQEIKNYLLSGKPHKRLALPRDLFLQILIVGNCPFPAREMLLRFFLCRFEFSAECVKLIRPGLCRVIFHNVTPRMY